MVCGCVCVCVSIIIIIIALPQTDGPHLHHHHLPPRKEEKKKKKKKGKVKDGPRAPSPREPAGRGRIQEEEKNSISRACLALQALSCPALPLEGGGGGEQNKQSSERA
ncbi:hypothetical protein JDV02_009294 [Purpureocillium takamizusanense]|uniref:Secreted protein n=1 Tax=Purpureocillium takamizusanense TaxID=2060973 RepID=A0A9Q8QRD6_9HYPO|nr:uncharacterized protein JDV02_009294 [Purpureocillium takamizusanense]UNI23476.1 hypothetical protein JDV02_009294 [Purpureocillium takamizusanense]